MCGVGVVVDTSVEDSSCVLADTRSDESLSTWVILDEICDIVDDTSNGNECAAVLGLGLVSVPVDDRQLLESNTPVKSLSLLVKLLLHLLETALFDFILLELLQVVSETQLLPDPDRPLSWVILKPFDSIAVVRWELVVEVVVTFAQCDESSDNMITWRIAVIEWLVAEPMGQGVDTEGGLLNDEDSENTSVDESTHPVTPTKSRNKTREDHTHEYNALDVVAVLPDNDGVVIQIGDIGTTDALWILLHYHPSNMRVNETLSDRVGVLVGIGVSVMSSVISRPPSD